MHKYKKRVPAEWIIYLSIEMKIENEKYELPKLPSTILIKTYQITYPS